MSQFVEPVFETHFEISPFGYPAALKVDGVDVPESSQSPSACFLGVDAPPYELACPHLDMERELTLDFLADILLPEERPEVVTETTL
jgi:hypothetical protein